MSLVFVSSWESSLMIVAPTLLTSIDTCIAGKFRNLQKKKSVQYVNVLVM